MSSRTFATLLLLAPFACAARPLDGDTSATDATADTSAASTATAGGVDSGATTSSPTSTSATSAPDPSTSAGSANTSANFTDMGQPQPGGPCDPWIDDCPEGQKCMPYSDNGGNEWNAYKCSPIVPDPDGLYEPCGVIGSQLDGEDTCDEHMMCWDVDPDTGVGHCVGMCTGNPQEPGCADAEATCILSDAGVLLLCLPGCNPLLQDCAQNELCIPSPISTTFFCVQRADGVMAHLFDPCEYINVCDPGLVCVTPDLAAECDPMTIGCCLPFCDLSVPNDCPGQGQQCLPWYEQGQAPAGLENVGVCGLPQP